MQTLDSPPKLFSFSLKWFLDYWAYHHSGPCALRFMIVNDFSSWCQATSERIDLGCNRSKAIM